MAVVDHTIRAPLAVEVDSERPGISELAARRAWEAIQARAMRGHCRDCGHSWRPRNPAATVNRCPGCGVRGRVNYARLSDQVDPASVVKSVFGNAELRTLIGRAAE